MPLQDDPHENWHLAEQPEVGALAAKHRLVAETKRLVDVVALLDVDASDEATIDELTAALRSVTDTAATRPSHRDGGLAQAPTSATALRERSPFSGLANPLAAPMTITVDGAITRATATYTAAYEGPPATLHGGFVAAAFDDLLGVAQMASGDAGFTGTLTVRMRRPTPLFTPIEYEAGVREVRGRKIVCWGTATADGEVVAEAEGLFLIPKERYKGD